MQYSRPGPTQRDTDKIRERLSGAVQPNAATGALPGSEPSRPPLNLEQARIAEANRAARAANVAAHAAKSGPRPSGPAQGKPVALGVGKSPSRGPAQGKPIANSQRNVANDPAYKGASAASQRNVANDLSAKAASALDQLAADRDLFK
jgi:hypothetical protein